MMREGLDRMVGSEMFRGTVKTVVDVQKSNQIFHDY